MKTPTGPRFLALRILKTPRSDGKARGCSVVNGCACRFFASRDSSWNRYAEYALQDDGAKKDHRVAMVLGYSTAAHELALRFFQRRDAVG